MLEFLHNESELLLHVCCAPCSSAIVEKLMNTGIRPTLFFYNPNIFPREEYEKRKNECIRHAESVEVDFVDADYEHDKWLEWINGLENEPERGKRCLKCFKIRLLAAAKYASENSFKTFATTLSTSRWKNLDQINEAGALAVSRFPELTFMAENWRKGGLSERRSELIRQYGFYNQTYCGCEFSMRER
ncbi:MAG: epoxyqueuosine reductase QueH [Tannerella sp.]|jgi:predicted adenine nucleotide alpha hydrolase (AANH) superfamily ATPase|nr:epoxyqueuosine reductase QueH [Tannerella sp.]